MKGHVLPIIQRVGGFPAIHSPVYETKAGTPYLDQPGVVLIAQPDVNFGGLREFLGGYDPDYEFEAYLMDPDALSSAEALVKVAGQTCYASWGPKRSWNKDAKKYLDNIKDSGHGSVLEHANFSVLLYGISRSNSHEIVRHRHGAYSQLSQRYVSGRVLRFVEPSEYVVDSVLHADFLAGIDEASDRYERRAKRLYELQAAGLGILSGEQKTDLRKKVQQAARSGLPNETETVMVMTANVRAWRHVIEMRASAHAATEIRETFFRVFLCLREAAPLLFDDYEIVEFPDGTCGVKTPYEKV